MSLRADDPFIENGSYFIQYGERADGSWHAWRDERSRKVRYSRGSDHPPDPHCPGCKEQQQ